MNLGDTKGWVVGAASAGPATGSILPASDRACEANQEANSGKFHEFFAVLDVTTLDDHPGQEQQFAFVTPQRSNEDSDPETDGFETDSAISTETCPLGVLASRQADRSLQSAADEAGIPEPASRGKATSARTQVLTNELVHSQDLNRQTLIPSGRIVSVADSGGAVSSQHDTGAQNLAGDRTAAPQTRPGAKVVLNLLTGGTMRAEEQVHPSFGDQRAASQAGLPVWHQIWRTADMQAVPATATASPALSADPLTEAAEHAVARREQAVLADRNARPEMSELQARMALANTPDLSQSNRPSGGFAQSSEFSDVTETTVTRFETPAATRVLPPAAGNNLLVTGQPVVAQLGAKITSARHSSIEISLSPEELGKVRITLHPLDNRLQIFIISERPETQDLLRRNSEDLLRELRALGHDAVDLNFADRRGGQSMPQDLRDGPQKDGFMDAGDKIEATSPVRRRISGALDLRI